MNCNSKELTSGPNTKFLNEDQSYNLAQSSVNKAYQSFNVTENSRFHDKENTSQIANSRKNINL